jgi:hypothetical protein
MIHDQRMNMSNNRINMSHQPAAESPVDEYEQQETNYESPEDENEQLSH